ncbi:hypothetical protein KVR01_011713 [Diaporthe batatas]|uniref:uncharacterized protein n=1 Tax=Diaporthe batatas TaxID=748121 RepID=UPI001D047A38|nr:uncharacterized protein KVR01_011713 [Diaporthe batatas]KAG8158591.1 hypothetical protein KVR01_011713 [Diaporthe batatas]
MGSPLSPMHHAAPNGTATYADDMEDQFEDALESHTHSSSPLQQRRSTGSDSLDGASSPFVAGADDHASQSSSQSSNQENVSPSKDKRRSRIMSGSEISPLKMLQRSSTDGPIPEADEKLAPPAPKSPRKSVSPMRRFPVKINNSIDSTTTRSRPQSMHAAPRERHMSYSEDPSSSSPPAATTSSTTTSTTNGTTQEREMTLEEAIAQNPGVKHAIEIFEDSISSIDDDDDDDSGPDGEGPTVKGPMDAPTPPSDTHDETAGDETMMSTFSNFSAIPNMTTFARLGGRTPTQMAREDPRRESNSTNLLDFTDNLRFPGGGRTSPTKNLSMADAKKTPQRQNIANLLDFDIPPMPTPRSLPSITARELESLKSNFMSEISGLRATLSGKDAEVISLKTALGSAEKRAGETMEALREERSMREQYSEEKDMWEKRGREMETVLRQVKEEIMKTSREREEFESKLEESEGRREAAEMMAQEAEARMASMRAREASAEARAEAAASPGGLKNAGNRASQREIEIAVEKVARELHAAYKKKHEDKVAALKKTYEGRWDKKIRELEGRIGDLAKENEELKLGRDATMTKVELERAAVEEERKAQAIKDSAQIKELQAEVEKLEAVVRTVQDDNADLRQQLESERVEKGELVTLAEELMQMQAQQQSVAAQQQQQIEQQLQEKQHQQRREPSPQQQHHPAVTPKRVPQRASAPPPARTNSQHTTTAGGFSRPSTMTPKKAGGASPSGIPGTTKSGYRNSMIGRPGGGGPPPLSGLKPPGGGTKIGGGGVIGVAPAHHGRTQSNHTGIARPGSGLARPGGLMSSIQQMGSYRGAGGRGE